MTAPGFTLVMLPPHTAVTRGWAARVAGAPGLALRVVEPETIDGAARDIAEAEAAFGTIPPEVLARAHRLRWLQAPQAAPPAGFHYPELVAHPLVVLRPRGPRAGREPSPRRPGGSAPVAMLAHRDPE